MVFPVLVLYKNELTNVAKQLGLNQPVLDQKRFFLGLGKRIRDLRRKRGYSQEDMISFAFSARHWQQIEAGRPITISTLLRICQVFNILPERLVRGLYRLSLV